MPRCKRGTRKSKVDPEKCVPYAGTAKKLKNISPKSKKATTRRKKAKNMIASTEQAPASATEETMYISEAPGINANILRDIVDVIEIKNIRDDGKFNVTIDARLGEKIGEHKVLGTDKKMYNTVTYRDIPVDWRKTHAHMLRIFCEITGMPKATANKMKKPELVHYLTDKMQVGIVSPKSTPGMRNLLYGRKPVVPAVINQNDTSIDIHDDYISISMKYSNEDDFVFYFNYTDAGTEPKVKFSNAVLFGHERNHYSAKKLAGKGDYDEIETFKTINKCKSFMDEKNYRHSINVETVHVQGNGFQQNIQNYSDLSKAPKIKKAVEKCIDLVN